MATLIKVFKRIVIRTSDETRLLLHVLLCCSTTSTTPSILFCLCGHGRWCENSVTSQPPNPRHRSLQPAHFVQKVDYPHLRKSISNFFSSHLSVLELKVSQTWRVSSCDKLVPLSPLSLSLCPPLPNCPSPGFVVPRESPVRDVIDKSVAITQVLRHGNNFVAAQVAQALPDDHLRYLIGHLSKIVSNLTSA